MKLFLYALVHDLSGFKTLHRQLEERPDILRLVGLSFPPHRTTLGKRFKALPESVWVALQQLYQRFVEEGHSDPSFMSVDFSLMHAHGNVWHVKQMKAGKLPACRNIDTKAHWGISGAGEWVYGYRLHSLMSCGPYGLELPYDATVEPANVKDAEETTFVPKLPHEVELILADTGYHDEGCYRAGDTKNLSLLAPIKIKRNTPLERRERAELFYAPESRETYCLRKTTIEPYQGQLKDLFKPEHLPLKGLRNVRALALLPTLAYLLLVKLNLLLDRPPLQLKATLYALR